MTQLHYPDLDPAPGWPGFRAGTQMRLVPPGTPPQDAEAAIVVSPLLARSSALPPPAKLIEQTLAVDVQTNNIEIVAKAGPVDVKADSGLTGVSFDVQVRGRTGLEHRIYVLLVDDICYYGISFLASEAAFASHKDSFWTMMKSLRPFKGKLAPPAPAGDAFDHYAG